MFETIPSLKLFVKIERMHLYEVAVRYMCREFITTIKLAEERTYYNVRQLKLWHIIA